MVEVRVPSFERIFLALFPSPLSHPSKGASTAPPRPLTRLHPPPFPIPPPLRPRPLTRLTLPPRLPSLLIFLHSPPLPYPSLVLHSHTFVLSVRPTLHRCRSVVLEGEGEREGIGLAAQTRRRGKEELILGRWKEGASVFISSAEMEPGEGLEEGEREVREGERGCRERREIASVERTAAVGGRGRGEGASADEEEGREWGARRSGKGARRSGKRARRSGKGARGRPREGGMRTRERRTIALGRTRERIDVEGGGLMSREGERQPALRPPIHIPLSLPKSKVGLSVYNARQA